MKHTFPLKDIAFTSAAFALMGGLSIASADPTLASTIRQKAEHAISGYSQQIPTIPAMSNLPSIDQAFNVIGRDNI